jgi:hypothetical protein
VGDLYQSLQDFRYRQPNQRAVALTLAC